ncbi:MAG: response regulator transcription factor [Bacillota bacterium]
MVNVLVAVDKPIWRMQLEDIFEQKRNIRVGYADSLDNILMQQQNCYEVIILNLGQYGDQDTLKNVSKIKHRHPRSRLVLVVHPMGSFPFCAFVKSGVLGFIDERATPDQIEAAVSAATRGDLYISAPLIDRGLQVRSSLVDEFFKDVPDLNCDLSTLTEREFEMIKLVAQGKSNRDIAEELFVSEKTVKNHLYNAFKKLGVKDRTQAAIAVIKGLLSYENRPFDPI